MRASQEEKTIARVLHAFGVPYTQISKLFGRNQNTIAEWCNHSRATIRQLAGHRQELAKRLAGIPQRSAETNRRSAIRRAARVEAKLTGEPVEEIYKRWGVVSKHSRRAY